MKAKLGWMALLLLLMTPGVRPLSAQATAPAGVTGASSQRLFIDPSSSAVSFGKAYLTVNPLTRKGQLYVGDYKLTVVPYFMMSERGILELGASDDVMGRILAGAPTAFTGKASNNKQGPPKVIVGKITPAAGAQGGVTFSVQTDNGPMVFTTSYHFGK